MFNTICEIGDALTYIVLKTAQFGMLVTAVAVFVMEVLL